jgi:hypothetical protein
VSRREVNSSTNAKSAQVGLEDQMRGVNYHVAGLASKVVAGGGKGWEQHLWDGPEGCPFEDIGVSRSITEIYETETSVIAHQGNQTNYSVD